MAQYHGNLVRLESRTKSPDPPKISGTHSRAQTLDSKTFDERYHGRSVAATLAAVNEEGEDSPLEFDRPILRIDACLGEWLSPDYYDFTTAPPPSNMMVALAKAELIRSADSLQGAKITEPDGSVVEFPSGSSANESVHHQRQRSSTFGMGEIVRAMLRPPSSNEAAPAVDSDNSVQKVGDNSPLARPRYAGYIPPTPTYALLHSAPIPRGYVSHARDACVEIDFQWDSMREPQSWGDGGSFGEEWSAMHRRFRGGIASMVSWYKDKGLDFDPQDDEKITNNDNDDGNDIDIVLVILTHGAGCNALIGALTNQPVLMDIGMGSLTMAVRKPLSVSSQSPSDGRRTSPTSFRRRRRSSVIDVGLSEEYDMKLTASTEHLRAGPDPLVIPQLAHPGAMPFIPELSRRGSSVTSSGTSTPQDSAHLRSKNSSLGSMRRTSVRSSSSRTFSPSPLATTPASGGLWGSRGATVQRVDEDAAVIGRVEHDDTISGASEPVPSLGRHHSLGAAPTTETAGGAPGLWGSAPRKEDSKRRYTVGARKS